MPLEERREKRATPRAAAEGEVQLLGDQADQLAITGKLLDISAGGFRAAHNCAQLGSGQVLRFRHPDGSGRARVVWNRITEHGVETGFVVIAPVS